MFFFHVFILLMFYYPIVRFYILFLIFVILSLSSSLFSISLFQFISHISSHPFSPLIITFLSFGLLLFIFFSPFSTIPFPFTLLLFFVLLSLIALLYLWMSCLDFVFLCCFALFCQHLHNSVQSVVGVAPHRQTAKDITNEQANNNSPNIREST